MRIQPYAFSPVSYKGARRSEKQVFSYDDPSLQEARAKMRENLLSEVIAEEKQDKVLEEWEFNHYVDGFVGLKRSSDAYFKPLPEMSSSAIYPPSPTENEDYKKHYNRYLLMKKLPSYNVEPVYGTKDTYRGSMLTKDNAKEGLEILKKVGISTVVDLVGADIEEEVKEQGLNYVYVPSELLTAESDMFKTEEDIIYEIKHLYNRINASEQEMESAVASALDCHRENTKIEKEHLIKLVQAMQKDDVYIGCSYGKYRTDWALIANNLLNPQAKDTDFYAVDGLAIAFYMERLYANLTDEDKARMGWTKEFDEEFLPKIQKIIDESW